MDKELMLDVGQADELKLAMRKHGWTNADLKRLCHPEMMQEILNVLRGQATVEMVKHIIDCDATPFIPEGWSIHPEDQIASRVTGQFEFDSTKVGLFLTDKQKLDYEVGNDLKQALEGQLVLPANVLDYMLEHPDIIPESWKGKVIFFWGTIYRSSDGDLFVRYLFWNGGRWRWNNSYWLDNKWDDNNPAAVSAS